MDLVCIIITVMSRRRAK